jgi:hypothetical protein
MGPIQPHGVDRRAHPPVGKRGLLAGAARVALGGYEPVSLNESRKLLVSGSSGPRGDWAMI